MARQSGFTLIEIITVLVILAIVASISTQFVVDSLDSYRTAQIRSRLLGKSRLALEQITRYARGAVPNSVRVSASGNCVELMPMAAGLYYQGALADANNNAPISSSAEISQASFDLDAPRHLIVSPWFSGEIYSSAMPSARANYLGISGSLVSFSAHRFLRNSPHHRLYLGDDPVRFCLRNGNLQFHKGYSVSTVLGDADPGGNSALLATNVSSAAQAFALSAGSENRNASLDLNLRFSEGAIAVTLNQTILVRNVP